MASPLALVTGFPGFIGSRLVAGLLERDRKLRVAALVEPRMAERARAAAAQLDGKRVDVLEGDIGEPGLGLDGEAAERLREEMTAAYHLAAIYDLAVPLETAQRVNVEGTGHVLALCESAKRLERLNYVSTAFVAGDRHGVVYEHELALGQSFKNHYESTKFQAELWVHEARERVPTTTYRPAIVVGDSRSGETAKFDGPYYILRLASRLDGWGMKMAQVGRGSSPFNVVPVDFVVEAILAGASEPEAEGATLHLVDPEPLSSRELVALLTEKLTGREPGMRTPPRLVAAMFRSATVRRLMAGVPQQSIVYLNHSVRFDARQTTELLARHDLACPRFTDYVEPIVGFYREHEDDPAFSPG